MHSSTVGRSPGGTIRPASRGPVGRAVASSVGDLPVENPMPPPPDPPPDLPAGQPSDRLGEAPRSRRSVVRVLVATLAVAVVAGGLVVADHLLAAPGFDRGLAIDRAIDESGNRLTTTQAACYVDHVRASLGSRYLEPDAHPSAPIADRLTAIRDDCVGLSGLGALGADGSGGSSAGAGGGVPSTEAGNLPLRHGDAPALDALWSRCAAGYGQACDDLFDRSPIGSQYEAFALTCGGRTRELQCAAVYRSPGVTTPTTAPTGGVPAP